MYGKQEEYESQLKKVGLVNDNAYSCASYLDENENKPKSKYSEAYEAYKSR